MELDNFEKNHLNQWLKRRFNNDFIRNTALNALQSKDPQELRELINANWTWQQILDTTNFSGV